MDRTYPTTFDDHYRFKCLTIVMDKEIRHDLIKDFIKTTDKALNVQNTLDLFFEKMTANLLEKLLPKNVQMINLQGKRSDNHRS